MEFRLNSLWTTLRWTLCLSPSASMSPELRYLLAALLSISDLR
jgi:hypothetical protein